MLLYPALDTRSRTLRLNVSKEFEISRVACFEKLNNHVYELHIIFTLIYTDIILI